MAFFLIFGGAVLEGLAHLFQAVPPQAIGAMMPQTRPEMALPHRIIPPFESRLGA